MGRIESIEERLPVHDRHHHIEEDEARVLPLSSENVEALSSIGGTKNAVAVLTKDLHEEFAEVLRILNHQHGFHLRQLIPARTGSPVKRYGR